MSEFYSRGRYAFVAGALASVLFGAGCTSASEREPNILYAQDGAHFAVACPDGGQPGITEIAHISGEMPVEPTSARTAQAVARIACLDGSQQTQPKLVEDITGEGKCLGYLPGQYHLFTHAEQRGTTQLPEFFITDDSPTQTISVLGQPQDDLAKRARITEVSIHRHDLNDPSDKGQYVTNGCS